MNNLSVLDNLLSPARADRLVAVVIADIVNKLDKPLDDDGYAEILNSVMNTNPASKIVNSIDVNATVELAARLIVELEWQSRQGHDNGQAMHGLAVYLAEWLQERIEEVDAEEDEYENGAFEDEDDEEK
jgi:hypothetical protein